MARSIKPPPSGVSNMPRWAMRRLGAGKLIVMLCVADHRVVETAQSEQEQQGARNPKNGARGLLMLDLIQI